MPAILGQGQEGSSSDGRGGEKMQSNERSETEENILLYMNKTSINISMKESDVTESSETVMAEELNETETSQCKFARKMNRTDKLTSKIGIETDIPVKTEKEDDWIESGYDWGQNNHENIEKNVDRIVPTDKYAIVLEANESKKKVGCKIIQPGVRKKIMTGKVCQECEKAFQYAKELKRHETIHTDNTIYKCKLCKKSFKRSDKLKQHVTLH